MKLVALVLACIALCACTSQRSVGSTCDDGRCPALNAEDGAPCLISTGNPSLDSSVVDSASQCVLEPVIVLPGDMTPCRLYLATNDMAVSCADLMLNDVTDMMPVMFGPVCELPQLRPGISRVGSESRATGWYLEHELTSDDPCAGIATQRVVLNGPVPQSTYTWLSCAVALAKPDEVGAPGQLPTEVEPGLCAGLGPLPHRTPDDIGAVCDAHVTPSGGFRAGHDYVDVRSEQCSTGVCLVNALNAPVADTCTDPDDCTPMLDDHVYCSCRCDPKGDTSRARCTCPAEYECQEVLSPAAPAEIAGGYCVRTTSRGQ